MDFSLIEARPGLTVVLLPDAPTFTVVAVSHDFEKLTGVKRERIVGKGHFEPFPQSPGDSHFTGEDNLKASYECVIRRKEPHRLPLQRYDIPDGQGGFLERYWKVVNVPVLNKNGELCYLIHTAEDITSAVQAKKTVEAHQELRLAYRKIEESGAALQKAHEYTIDILESTTDAFYALDGDFNLTYVNRRAAQLWGRDRDALIGKQFWAEFPSAVGSESYHKHYEALREGKPVHYETVSPVLGIWIEVGVYPVRGEGLSVFFRDIAESKRVEETLREREARYRSLFNSVDQGFCILELIFDGGGKPIDYRFLETNPVFEDQTGLKGAAGKTARELVPHLESHWFEIYGNVALTGEAIRFTEGSEAMGRLFDVYAFRPGDAASRKVALLFTDITERSKAEAAIRQSEQNLRNTILHAPVAMFIFRGEDMVIDTINEKALEMIKRTEAVIGKPLLEAIPELTDSPAYEIFKQIYRTGVAQYGREVLVPLERAGTLEDRYFNFTYTPLTEAGQVVGVIDVATDVTEQVLARQKIEEVVAQRTGELAQANAALLQANKELSRSNANLEEFAYAASHDLKEPVRKIHFFTHQLSGQLKARLTENEMRSFGRIENATRRMGKLIDDLLVYSHVSQQPHETEAIDLNEKLKRVLEDLELAVEDKKAIFRIGELPVVQGYRRQLQQLFQNLLGNALKYSKKEVPPQIDITAEQTEVGGADYHAISVADNGIGFEQEYAAKIFQMFSRLHGKDEYGGTGIGLAIVKKVVENHNGFIRVQSRPGEGSLFKIFLPVSTKATETETAGF